MGFLDRISESIAETGQGLKNMADQSSAKGQMNSDLRKKEKELENLVYQIGFQMVSNEPDLCKEKCGDLYEQLLSTREAAKSLRDQLALTNLERPCPGCGRIVKGPVLFCTHCGNKMPEVNMDTSTDFSLPNKNPVVQNPSGETCSSCGAPLKEGAGFCVNCGTPVPGAQTQTDADALEQAVERAPVVGTCKNCGAELEADDAFCTSCGTPV